jgi:hypothetical protein
LTDIGPLLRPGLSYDAAVAIHLVRRTLIELLPGKPWRGIVSEKRTKSR